MKQVHISDITLKQAGKGQFDLSFREKIELAKLLDRLGVDTIEAAPIANRKIDSLLIKSLATAVKSSRLAVPVDIFDEESPALTFAALKEAKKIRLQIPVPVSTVQMEYICRRKPAAVLELYEMLQCNKAENNKEN